MSNDTEFELEYWQDRVDALAVTNQALQEERDRYMDAADSLAKELDALKATMKQAESIISTVTNPHRTRHRTLNKAEGQHDTKRYRHLC
jgi:predicted nuclease with TOPRIM domain